MTTPVNLRAVIEDKAGDDAVAAMKKMKAADQMADALRPFAEIARHYPLADADDVCGVSIEDLRRAASALAAAEGPAEAPRDFVADAMEIVRTGHGTPTFEQLRALVSLIEERDAAIQHLLDKEPECSTT